MEKVSTKDRILDAALTLFSEKGYDGVGVDLIASSVGMKGPSLYKHFKGKEDILNALVEKVGEYYEMNFGSEERPGKLPASKEEMIELSMGRLMFTIKDPTIKKVRKLLAIEQFRNPKIAELATLHNIRGLQSMYKSIFSGMMEAGMMRKTDPEMLAMSFVAPVTLLIQICDRQPEKEEAILGEIRAYMEFIIKEYAI